MSPDRRHIQFSLPTKQWEDFYRHFPGQGERTRVLRKMIKFILKSAESKDLWFDKLKEDIKRFYLE